jgi:hypothetical protein
MRYLSFILIVSLLLTISVPAYAVASIFTAIPDDYYIHFFAGAAIQGLLFKHDVAPMESFYITIGIAVAKELVDSAVLGGQFDWTEAAVMVLGSSFMYYF